MDIALKYLGWKGGTVHQVVDELRRRTGVERTTTLHVYIKDMFAIPKTKRVKMDILSYLNSFGSNDVYSLLLSHTGAVSLYVCIILLLLLCSELCNFWITTHCALHDVVIEVANALKSILSSPLGISRL